MAPPGADRTSGGFGLRLVSSVALAIPAIAAIIYGFPYFTVLVGLFALALAWEWSSLCAGNHFDWLVGPVLVGSVLLAVGLGAAGLAGWALIAVVLGAALTYAGGRASEREHAVLGALGVVYVGVPCIALLWLRQQPVGGRDVVLWLVAAVVATDIGAYAVGQTVGGPRLAPRISPGKTWSGLLGGVACAAVVGAVAADWLGGARAWPLAATSAALGVVSQAGDLLESAVKRRFGVKDMSTIIPGHGGVFDRVDGLLAAALVVAAVTLASGGSVLSWR